MAKEIRDESFEEEVLNSNVPVLVDFWATWCGPCRMLGPIMDGLAEELEGKAKIFKMNVDECPDIASDFSITAIPTVVVFKNGSVFKKIVGVQPKASYIEALESK